MKITKRFLVAVPAALLLIGCASSPPTPPREKITVPLVEPVGFVVNSVNPPSYVEVRGVVVFWSPLKSKPTPGTLWIGLGKAPFLAAWDSVQSIQLQGRTDARVTLKNGSSYTPLAQWWFLCPAGMTPTSPDQCTQVSEVVQARQDLRAYAELPKDSYTRDVRSTIGFGDTLTTFRGPAEAAVERERLAKAFVNYQRGQAARQAAQVEDNLRKEQARKDRIAKAAVGSEVNCTSYSLVQRGNPVEPHISFNCATIGMTSMNELRAAGWVTRVTGRIPTEGMMGIADSIEMVAVKQR